MDSLYDELTSGDQNPNKPEDFIKPLSKDYEQMDSIYDGQNLTNPEDFIRPPSKNYEEIQIVNLTGDLKSSLTNAKSSKLSDLEEIVIGILFIQITSKIIPYLTNWKTKTLEDEQIKSMALEGFAVCRKIIEQMKFHNKDISTALIAKGKEDDIDLRSVMFPQSKTPENNPIPIAIIRAHPSHFADYGFLIWEHMFASFDIIESSRTDLRFMFDVMQKDGYIHKTVRLTDMLNWINDTYELAIDKLQYNDFKKDSKRNAIYSYAKSAYLK